MSELLENQVSQTNLTVAEVEQHESSARRVAYRLSARGLTHLLGLMCLVPILTIGWLWFYLPPVYEGKLQCSVTPAGLPHHTIYSLPYQQRETVSGSAIIVRNDSDERWTHINVVINTFYQIYDIEPLNPGEEREYLLNRFVSRTGARFEIRYNPLKTVRVYARRPRGDRATYFQEFTAK